MTVAHVPSAIRVPSASPDVGFTGITTVLGAEIVLEGLSLSVPGGQTTVVMGPSGAGKTTMLRHLLGLLEPDEGEVVVDGRSVWSLAPTELADLRHRMGVLLGGSTVFGGSLFDSLTVLENVAYPLRMTGSPAGPAEDRARALLEEFDLSRAAELLPGVLSAGTRRRVALAKALVAEPSLVVLDDPGTAVDVVNRTQILRSIRDAQERLGATFLITTHSISIARELGDHMAILVDGRIAASGSPDEVLRGVDDPDDFDDRFRFSRHQVTLDPARVGALAETAQAERTVLVHGPVAIMFLVLVLMIVVMSLGFLENPMP